MRLARAGLIVTIALGILLAPLAAEAQQAAFQTLLGLGAQRGPTDG